MSICPNTGKACQCQPQDGVMCPYGPTPNDWKPWAPDHPEDEATPPAPGVSAPLPLSDEQIDAVIADYFGREYLLHPNLMNSNRKFARAVLHAAGVKGIPAIAEYKPCPDCSGSGIADNTAAMDDCKPCNGTGRLPADGVRVEHEPLGYATKADFHAALDACPECGGAGEFESALHCEKCNVCGGTGKRTAGVGASHHETFSHHTPTPKPLPPSPYPQAQFPTLKGNPIHDGPHQARYPNPPPQEGVRCDGPTASTRTRCSRRTHRSPGGPRAHLEHANRQGSCGEVRASEAREAQCPCAGHVAPLRPSGRGQIMGLSRILTPFLRVFRAPSYSSVVIEDLAQAELDLLQAHGQMEYAQAMLIYHTARVSRLRKVNFSAVREGPAAETYLPNSLRAVP